MWCNGYQHRKLTRDQILDEAVCILYSANILGEFMHPTNFSPAMGK